MPRPCPICRHDAAEAVAEGEDFEYRSMPGPFEIFRCEACGHLYLDPLPPPDVLPALYPPTYYTVNPESPIQFTRFLREQKLRRDLGRIVSLMGERLPRSVVDLGCGDGERLARLGGALAERGAADVDLCGVDLQPDPHRLEELGGRGVRMISRDIEEGLDFLPDGGTDLVIMCQLIEHLRDPVAILDSLKRKLAPGGRLLLETPSPRGYDYRLFRRRYWGGYHFPRHFHVFTPGTLAGAVLRAGLRVGRAGYLPSGFGIVSLRNRLGLSSVGRGRSFSEFISMKSLVTVGFFAAIDLAWIAVGGATSNQYLLAEKP